MEYTCVKLRKNEAIVYAHSNNIFVQPGSKVIIETDQGVDYAVVLQMRQRHDKPVEEIHGRVLRLATEEENSEIEKIKELEDRAFSVCREKAKEKGLEMKLVNVKSLFDRTKIIFYFVSENRIDFRELVRDLASVFRTRIEMRQIGVRDESRMIDGYGPCGQPLCCTKFQGNFAPVSIKMAKEQNLNLNSLKISGICGRLLCCLEYEYQVYNDLNQTLPSQGSKVLIGEKSIYVEAVDTLKETIRIRYNDAYINVHRKEMVPEGNTYRISENYINNLNRQHEEENVEEPQEKLWKRNTM